MLDPTILSAGVIVFGVVMYVILDGFDLGVGVLAPVAGDEHSRDVMINSIAPVWDGNETWLILGGAVLFAAFPLAYAIVLPALYVPIMLLLFALVFRGVAFEFRHSAHTSKGWWTVSFSAGSILAAFAQGLLLGGLIEGIRVEDKAFAGGPFDWLTLGAVIDGFALVAGYGLLGATWLVMKAEKGVRDRAKGWARVLTLAVLFFMAVVSLYTPLTHEAIAERWFGGWNLLYLSPVPIATAAAALLLWTALNRDWSVMPFVAAVLLFLLGFLGLAISLWPYIVPPSITIEAAAAPPSSQWFTLIGVAVTMPMVLFYTGYAYHVFRGRAGAGHGYGGE